MGKRGHSVLEYKTIGELEVLYTNTLADLPESYTKFKVVKLIKPINIYLRFVFYGS